MLGVNSREEKAVAPAPSLCIAGYQTLVSRVVRVCLWLCSDNQEIATRSASARLHQASPYGCSVPWGRSRAPSRRVRTAGSRAAGKAVGMHLAGAGDRTGPAETSQLCGAGWQPLPRLPLLPQPPSHPPCHAASCLHRNAPGSDTRLLPDRQAAVGCSNPAELGPVLPTSSAGEGVTGHSHRAGTLLPHH